MLLTKNRKAFYNYEILDKFTAGLELKGYEVKAIKEHRVNLDGSYVAIVGGIPYVLNMHVGKYSKQSQDINGTDENRSRRLLLTKTEIEKLKKESLQKGKSIVPLALILTKNLIKLELAVVRGRHNIEKKHLEKERQIKRDLEIAVKSMGM